PPPLAHTRTHTRSTHRSSRRECIRPAMAIDEPIKRKRGTPAGDPHSAKSKMRQKMVHPRHALLDERSSRHGDDDDFDPMGKGGTPAGDSPHSARTKMGHKMSLAHRRLSFLDDGSGISRHIAAAAAAADDDGGAFELMVRTFMQPSDLTFLHTGTYVLQGFRVSNTCSHIPTQIDIGSPFYQLVSQLVGRSMNRALDKY
uniref:Uncharacterized protein n=1 Tax=Aegilops tauschii subsp. strangulata TaxID=200361 RepID=A0A453MSS9_AEGTS